MSDPREERVFLGHAVEKGRIRFISVSQISKADPDNGDGGCMRKWAFEYVFGKKLKKTTALVKGDDFAQKLYHYLTTGEECLPPTLQIAQKLFPAPGPDLECEQKFATGEKGVDILKAIGLREAYLKEGLPQPWPNLILSEIKKFAGLTIRGIPVDGAADFRHRRGEYVDEDWILKPEPRGIIVAETGDLKTVSRIHPEVIKGGQNRGDVLPSFVKSSAEVCNDIQMVSYGVYSLHRHPDVTHVRLSHIIANKRKREAAKRTGLVSVDELLSRFRRIEGVVEEMEGVAQATSPADVRPNLSACDAYTHVDPNDPTGKNTLKGCGHRYYCPLSITQVGPSLMGIVQENAMSLFDQLDGPVTPAAPPAPPPPPLTGAEYDAAVAAERAKFTQVSGAMAPCPDCGAPRDLGNISVLQDGVTVKHINCPGASAAAPPPPPPPTYGSIVPPDAPKQDMTDPAALVELADPLSADEIAKVEDPALRAKLELHARMCAEKAAKDAADKVAQGGTMPSAWCDGSNFRLIITTEIAVDGKYVCAVKGCGKSWTTKALKPALADGKHYAIIPKHKPAAAATNGAQTGVTAAPPPPPAPLPPAPPAPPPPPAPMNGNGHVGSATQLVNQLFGPEGTPPAPPPPPLLAPAQLPLPAAPPALASRREVATDARRLSTMLAQFAAWLEGQGA